jgi:hypothetical protein
VTPIALFIATAYGLSIALGLVVGLTGGSTSPLIGLRFASMFLPAAAVLVVRIATGERPIVRNHLPWAYVPIALLLIPVVNHLAMLPAAAAITGIEWEPWLHRAPDGLFHTPQSRGWGTLTLGGPPDTSR